MASSSRTLVSVLTGDLVASSRAGATATDQAMAALESAAQTLESRARGETRFTRFRGDGWQIVVNRPGIALRAALVMTAYLRAADLGLATRIAVGVGSAERLGTRDLSDAAGAAFEASGRALDTMPKGARLAFAAPDQDTDFPDAIFALAGWLSARWSQAQAEAIAAALQPERFTQATLADRIGVTRQAIQSRLATAGLDALEPALRAFERHNWEARG